MIVIDCSPSPHCRCCECQGRRCLVSHPGHSHVADRWERSLIDAVNLDRIMVLAEMRRNEMAENLRLACDA